MKNSIRLGVIYCAYQTYDYKDFINPWLDYRAANPEKLVISAVSVPFEEYKEITPDKDDGTTEHLRKLLANKQIDHLITEPKYVKEHIARNECLQFLLSKDVDFVMMLDSDEAFAANEIENLFKYLETNEDKEFIACYTIEFKNLTFSEKTYTKGFNPRRVWKVDMNNYRLSRCFYDNDMEYTGKITRDIKKDSDLPKSKIPTNLVWPIHKTWLNDERSRSKIKYQEKRWSPPHGNGCGFRWDEEKGLSFNESYFQRFNLPLPQVFEL